MVWCLVKHKGKFPFTFCENVIIIVQILTVNVVSSVGELR